MNTQGLLDLLSVIAQECRLPRAERDWEVIRVASRLALEIIRMPHREEDPDVDRRPCPRCGATYKYGVLRQIHIEECLIAAVRSKS